MHQTIGIVLQVIPFQDYHQIVSLYSPDRGLIKLIFKYSRKKNAIEPLQLLEVIFKEGRGDLLQEVNFTLLDSHLKLRESFNILNAALEILKALKSSQMDQKASPILFSLLLHYLNFLPKALTPATLSASFMLKILRHDGLMAFQNACSTCHKPLKEGGIIQGEFFCSEHTNHTEAAFNESEFQALKELALSRSMILLDQVAFTADLERKIRFLFEGLVAT